jgi:RNA polymerase sigma-70 factor, ECF subfamily
MANRSNPTFDDLYARLAPRVLALGFQLTGDPALAEDVLQETFLAVHRSLPKFRGDADPATWVYRIALNAGRRAVTRRARRRDRALAFAAMSAPKSVPDPDTAAVLYRALGRVSADHREVLSMLALRELSAQTVAQVLGIPVGTVHSRAHSARQALRALLASDELPGASAAAQPPAVVPSRVLE